MIQNGTRPAKHLHYVRKFEHFGGLDVPDFNLDLGVSHPDQDADGAPTACVGYTVSDIFTDIFGTYFSPDFSYAAARYLAGDGPGTDGTSFHAGMQAAVGVGGLLSSQATIQASAKGELFVSDWNNWSSDEKRIALTRVQNGIRNVLGLGDAFDSIRSAAYQSGIAISVGTPWFKEWDFEKNPVLPTPVLDGNYSSWHDYAVKGQKTINGVPYLKAKIWVGLKGDNGFVYLSREAINAAMKVPGSGALTFDKSAIRWVSLCGILVQRFPNLLPYLPKLLSS